MTTSADTLQELLDREEIRTLKARYFRYLDTKQWAQFRTLFTDDCTYEGVSAPPGSNADGFVAALQAAHAETITVHHGHTPEIRFLSAAEARGTWALMDHLSWPDGSTFAQRTGGAWGVTGSGYYQETYRKQSGGWKIAYMRISRLRVELLTGPRPAPLEGALTPLLDWIDA